MKYKTIIVFVALLSLYPTYPIVHGKQDFERGVYRFQELINQIQSPAISDYLSVFSLHDEFELNFEIIEEKHTGKPPCLYRQDCNYNSSKSVMFSYLRSQNGPIFRGTNCKNIKIFLYTNITNIRAELKQQVFPLEALIFVDQNHILKATFMMEVFDESILFNNIIVEGKNIGQLAQQYDIDLSRRGKGK